MRATLSALLVALLLAAPASGSGSVPTVDRGLTLIAGAPVVCYPTMAAYLADSLLPASSPGAAYWGYSTALQQGVIGLTPQVCAWLRHARDGWSGNLVSNAVFVLSHEIAHAHALDFSYAIDHAHDPVFLAQVAAVHATHPDVNATREAAADCVGVSRISEVGYRLGMRGHQTFAYLARFGRLDGYAATPSQCWTLAASAGLP